MPVAIKIDKREFVIKSPELEALLTSEPVLATLSLQTKLCAECEKPFIITQPKHGPTRQNHCSRRCRQREYARNYCREYYRSVIRPKREARSGKHELDRKRIKRLHG